MAWDGMPAPLFTNCENVANFLNFMCLSFLISKMKLITVSTSRVVMRSE